MALIEEHQVHADIFQCRLHMQCQLREVPLRQVAHPHRDGIAAALAQALRHRVGPVAQSLDGGVHLFAHHGRDSHVAVLHTRHSGQRHASLARHFGHGDGGFAGDFHGCVPVRRRGTVVWPALMDEPLPAPTTRQAPGAC